MRRLTTSRNLGLSSIPLFLLAAGCAERTVGPPLREAPTQTWSTAEAPLANMAEPPTTRPTPPPEPILLEEPERRDPETKQVLEVAKGTLIFYPHHARPETLRESVEGLISPEGSVTANPSLNNLIVFDRLETVRSVQKVLEQIDQPSPQLLCEARIIEVTLDSDLEYEMRYLLNIVGNNGRFFQDSNVDLRTPGASPTIDPPQGININIRPWQGSDGSTFDNIIRLLVTRGKARILSSPNLLVSPGNEASIITGEEQPIQSSQIVGGTVSTNTQFKRVGIKLRVLLQQISGDKARLEINPEVSTVTGFTRGTAEIPSNPIIAIRNVTSTLTMMDGEVLTVGGLLQELDRTIIRGIPGLMDIPHLGILFQSRRQQTVKTQLIFFMRIHILGEGKPYTGRAYKPGSTMDDIDARSGLILPEERKADPPERIQTDADVVREPEK